MCSSVRFEQNERANNTSVIIVLVQWTYNDGRVLKPKKKETVVVGVRSRFEKKKKKKRIARFAHKRLCKEFLFWYIFAFPVV